MPEDMILKAARFAERAHGRQTRKLPGGTTEPYIRHPGRVAGMVLVHPICEDSKTVAIALLHDTIEDTSATKKEIREEFGDSVADGVVLLTDPPPGAGNRAARKQMTRERLVKAPEHVKIIKLFDCLDNLRSMSPQTHSLNFLQLCCAEMTALVEAIGSADREVAQEVICAIHHLDREVDATRFGNSD